MSTGWKHDVLIMVACAALAAFLTDAAEILAPENELLREYIHLPVTLYLLWYLWGRRDEE